MIVIIFFKFFLQNENLKIPVQLNNHRYVQNIYTEFLCPKSSHNHLYLTQIQFFQNEFFLCDLLNFFKMYILRVH